MNVGRATATVCVIMLAAALFVSTRLGWVGTSASEATIDRSTVPVVSSGGASPRGAPLVSIRRRDVPTPQDRRDLAADLRAAELARISDEVAPFFGYNPALKSLHDHLRAEGRDEAWASRSKTMLAREYAGMPGIKDTDHAPQIHCGVTLCEVSGSLDFPERGTVMRSVQAPDVSERMWARGYHPMNQMFGPGRDGRQVFIGYYRREAPITVPAGGRR
ncbi:hypothetical protein D9601_15790 [Sphingomonas sp. MA1305]|uniref:hypothetical protein n=1 Tax=Sphingomonas sp. MA1305 TaxID=2479204 RepID=UPI0018DF96CC|nr:hypothetical protein [Sphingomonas sp. MA1305]MBI0476813.1 hypothetical protein [Sphingomonas sp. MA1305]